VRGMIDDAFAEIYREIPTERRFGIAASGQILRRVVELAHTTPERASVNKAIDDLVNLDARIQTEARKASQHPARRGFNRARLWDIWAEWKPAAHLCCAWVDWRQDVQVAKSRINPFNPATLIHFLGRSEVYREFGEHHVAPHAAKFRAKRIVTLLDPSETWRLRPDLKLATVAVPILPERDLE
jgi:hypothetical protein